MKIARYFPHFPKLLVVPPIVIGLGVLAFFVLNRAAPEKKESVEQSRTLRVIQVPMVDVVPTVVGHGTVAAGKVWQAIAEVGGRCVEIHPNLESGSVVAADEQVVRIDPAEYELTVAQLEAEIEQLKAQRAELEVRKSNDQASLEIEQSSLSLAEAELKRRQALQRQNAASETEVDQQMRNVLLQRQTVQKLQNSLSTLPHQVKALDASIAAKDGHLQQAKIDLSKTVLRTPFECRLGDVTLEVGQFLTRGQVLFEAQSTELVEVEAQVPFDQARRLIPPRDATMAPLSFSMDTMRKIFDVDVIVRVGSGDFQAQWQGRFSRIRERVDIQTRTAGIVVAVDRPYDMVIPGSRPPLVPGMFCEVELSAQPRRNQIIIPRLAVKDGHVCVVNSDSRLERRPVEISFAQADFCCLAGGLSSDDLLIVSDPTPAIEGMLVDPVPDDELLQRITDQAAGRGESR